MTAEEVWEELKSRQGEEFRTSKGLTFGYYIKGNEVFFSRKDKSVTKATVILALERGLKIMESEGYVSGPKRLGTFGASYLYPIFISIGVITDKPLIK